MIIQINTDNNLTVHESFNAELDERIKEKLQRFAGQLTRIEVHLSDENGSKEGQKDKRCLMEARMEGMQPIVVTDMDKTLRLIEEKLEDWRGKYICVANVHTTVTAHEDPDYQAVQNGAVMALPDGGPLSK